MQILSVKSAHYDMGCSLRDPTGTISAVLHKDLAAQRYAASALISYPLFSSFAVAISLWRALFCSFGMSFFFFLLLL